MPFKLVHRDPQVLEYFVPGNLYLCVGNYPEGVPFQFNETYMYVGHEIIERRTKPSKHYSEFLFSEIKYVFLSVKRNKLVSFMSGSLLCSDSVRIMQKLDW